MNKLHLQDMKADKGDAKAQASILDNFNFEGIESAVQDKQREDAESSERNAEWYQRQVWLYTLRET